jgi:beta-xylosidase
MMACFVVFCFSTGICQDLASTKPHNPPGTYLNPIGDPPIHLQDPFILIQPKRYFLFGIASSSDGFQCYESSDLAHWKLDGWAWRKSGIHAATGDLHSPNVFAYEGMFCMIYSARMPTGTRLAMAASVRPEGPYHDIHVPWLDLSDGSVEGQVFVDSNRKPFLVFSQKSARNGAQYSAIYGVALNKDLSKLLEQPTRLIEAGQRWELARSDASRCNEFPRMFKAGSKYYLTYSANNRLTPDYAIGLAVADKPLGPWTKSADNPLVSSHAEMGVISPGHCSPFQSIDGSEWFIIYDSLADPANPSGYHVVNLDRLVPQSDGKLAARAPTRTPQPLPSNAR